MSMRLITPVNRNRHKAKQERKRFQSATKEFFANNKERMLKYIIDEYSVQTKADKGNLVDQLLALLDVSYFADLPSQVQEKYANIAEDSMVITLQQLKKTIPEAEYFKALRQVHEEAVEMAKTQSASLVGKRWVNGVLRDNPNAAYRIDEATRELLRGDISTAIEEGLSAKAFRDRLYDSYAFSIERCEAIARTEILSMDVKANLRAYKDSGVIKKKVWLLSEDPCDLCLENAQQGEIDLDESFRNGDAPVHPNCECDIAAVMED